MADCAGKFRSYLDLFKCIIVDDFGEGRVHRAEQNRGKHEYHSCVEG
jgi:hypothetical protein